ncbi:MAG: hypothetical protein GYB31_05150 [Bacteroidetes bacterium]|nr:hypothetical protein [Bacteroidota bacterium]
MKKHSTPKWLFFILLFLPLQFAFKGTESNLYSGPIITLESSAERHWVQLDGAETIITLCGLDAGNSYHIQISDRNVKTVCAPSLKANPLFMGDGELLGDFGTGLLVKATSNCLSIRAVVNEETCPNPSGDIMLSISAQAGPKPPPSSSSMLMPPAISTNSGVPGITLIQDFLLGGNCFEVSNISHAGSNAQKGTFTNGASSIGFNSGVILSTGNTSVATGPNNQTGASTDEPNTATDVDLGQIVGAGVLNDVAKIEFDFVPTVDTIRFNYVFASEEYCDFTNSAFNDVFGFFISGPGINGPFSNNAENIAVVPGTTTPVTINNVNHTSNTAYYVGNIPVGDPQLNNANCAGHPTSGPPGTSDCQFDGFTTVLTAEAVVIPCSTYHIKLAIADVLDGIYDSAVFFEENSLELGGEAQVEAFGTVAGTNVVYEGCTGAYYEFIRDDPTDLSEPQVINFTISVASTAENGTDYVTIPLTVTIPAGQVSVQIPIDAINDGIPEGTETIILELESPCTCSNSTIEMLIEDPPEITTPLEDITICEGETPIDLNATASGGIPAFTYSWSTGGSSPNISVSPTDDETYYVTITDDCGNTTVDSATVTVLTAPSADLSGSGTLCANGGSGATVDLTITFTGDAPWEFTYAIDGVQQPPIVTSDNPYTLTIDATATYSLVSVANPGGGCPGPVSGSVPITEVTLSPNLTPINPLCNGEDDGSIILVVSGGDPAYTYQWDNGAGNSQNPQDLPAGTYNVTITDANGCEETASVDLTDPPILDATISNTQDVDCNNPTGNAGVNVSGGTPGYSYDWSNGGSGANVGNLPPGNYDVTVTDANGCEDIASLTIGENLTPPNAAAATNDILTCEQTTVSISGNGSSTGSEFTYNWSGPGIVSGGTTLDPEVNAPGTYTITVTNTDNGCTEMATVTVGEDITPPVANAVTDPITCTNPSVIIDGNGTSTGSEFNYNWSGPGIVSGGNTLNPEVNAPGTYTLTVANSDNGCETILNINVPDDTTPPAVNASGGTLTCVVTQLMISGNGSAVGPEYSYDWTTNDGNIVSGETTLNPMVDAPGTYTLQVMDASNGCDNTISVTVGLDDTPPIVDAGPPAEINCANPTITLDGTGSQSGPNITYNWSTNDGQIVGGSNTETPTVSEPGTYSITVINTNNGCIATDEVVVTEDVDLPFVQIAPADLIDCYNPEVTLDGTGTSTGNEFSYTWITSTGNIVSGGNTLNPVVNMPGNYTLIVSNSDNFCSDQLSVVVPADLAFPIANAGPPMEITCTISEVQLLGLGSSSGPEYTYNWTTATGNIISGGDTPTPIVNEPGTYVLTVTNTINGCETTAEVDVTVDANVPQADAGPNQEINCLNTTVVLDGSDSSVGGSVTYVWVTNDGNITSGANSLTPTVNEAGTYELQVTNADNGCVAISTAIVTEDNEIPQITIAPPAIISCDEPELVLDATGSSTQGDLDYVWVASSGGNIISGQNTLMPTVNAGGTYTLNIINNDNYCSNGGSVVVTDITDDPIIAVAQPETLTCGVTSIQLDGSGSEDGPNFQINWSTPNGNIVSGSDGLNPTVNAAGTYTLTITDTSNNCVSEEEVVVPEDVALPMVDAGTPNELNCAIESINLSGSAAGSANLQLQWSTFDGNIVSGANGLNPEIDAPGTYSLEVVNQDNECVNTDEVLITEDVILPNVDAGPASEINCYTPDYQLDGTASDSGNPFTYQWSTGDGNIVSGGTSLNPTVDAGGNYTLVILNTDNFCTDSASVQIAEDLILPGADAGANDVINCYALELNLDASGSDQGPAMEYNWQTSDGNIISGQDAIDPLIDQPGTYQLTVTNTDNGCVSTDDVLVDINLEEPVVDAGIGGELTCTNATIQLVGNAQGNIPGFEYEWETADGNILSGGDGLDPVVDAPGIYTLVVTDIENGCTQQDEVEVTQDANLPSAIVSPDTALNCVNNIVVLDGTASTQGPSVTFEWQVSNGGNIVSGDNTLTPTIDAAGQYTLIITDSANDCVDQTSLTIEPDTLNPVISFLPPDLLTCDLTSLDLSADVVSSSGNLEINWSTANGNIVDGANELDPTVDAPGTYTLEILDNQNGCSTLETVDVAEDVAFPDLDIDDPTILNCNVVELDLSGSYDSNGVPVDILWTSPDGNIVSGDTTLNPTVNSPGSYTLSVTNVENGCESTISIPVDQDIEQPIVEAGPPDILNCDITELNLSGENSSQGVDFEYVWTTLDGNIISGVNDPNPLVDAPGTYILEILNADNGCFNSDSVLVDEDVALPTAEAGDPGLLTCAITDYQLQGSGSTGTDIVYSWTTPDGNILNGADQPDPLVNAPGTYVLEVLNNTNGCETYDTVNVAEDVALPTAIIEDTDILTCVVTELNLSGMGSSSGLDFVYNWTTNDGSILNGADGLEPEIDAPGTYELEVTNTSNGCVSLETITVDEDITPPAADAGPASTLTCDVISLALDGSGSSQGMIYTYEWTTNNGNILNGETTDNPQIDAPGTYEILVTNTENGCTNLASVDISQDVEAPALVIAGPEILTCVLTSQNLDASASANGEYQWTTADGNIVSGANSPNPVVDAPGTYELLLENPDNGCTSTETVEVTENVIYPEADAGPDGEITCLVTSFNLSGTATGNSNMLDIEWTTNNGNILSGGNTSDPLIDQPGTYQIMVTDAENGCATTDLVEVIPNNLPPLVSAIDPAILTCVVEEVELDASASEDGADIAYAWSTTNGNILGDPASEVVSADAPGTYTFQVVNTYTGCEDEVSIIVEEDVEEPVVDAGEEWILPCDEDFINLNGTASASVNQLSFSWSTTNGSIVSGAQSLDPAVNAGGVYELLVTNMVNGCTSSDFTEVTEVKPEEALWDPESPICVDDHGVLIAVEVIGGTPPYVYSIDGGNTFNTSNVFVPLDPGSYDVVVQDALGCEVTGVEVIEQPQEVVVDLETRVELEFGDSYQLQAQTNLVPGQIGSVQWSPATGLDCTDCLNPIATPFETTEYEVVITDINGCVAEGRVLLVVDRSAGIYIPNAFSPDTDGNNDVFMIFAKDNTVKEVQSFLVFSRWGETVFEYSNFQPNDPAFGWDGNHRGEPLNPAVFAWYAIIEMADGRIELFEGDVTLVR